MNTNSSYINTSITSLLIGSFYILVVDNSFKEKVKTIAYRAFSGAYKGYSQGSAIKNIQSIPNNFFNTVGDALNKQVTLNTAFCVWGLFSSYGNIKKILNFIKNDPPCPIATASSLGYFVGGILGSILVGAATSLIIGTIQDRITESLHQMTSSKNWLV